MKPKLTWLMILVFLAVTPAWAGAQTKTGKREAESPQGTGYPFPPRTVVAFSLKVLQQKLQENPEKTLGQEDVKHLAGITRIHGYVVDEANHDLILYGEVNPDLPLLSLDDFVVALKNAWLKYAELKGNTYYYSDPGCSIDPNPQVMANLGELSKRLHKTADIQEKEQVIQQWRQVCHSPQTVRVLGIPFDNRFAWVMVKADYDMKTMVNGTDFLSVPGFTSLADMRLETVKGDVVAGRPSMVPVSSMNRFWFHPGKNLYKEDQGVVKITQCPVILLTEEEHLTHGGEIIGKGHADPMAQKFAEMFSDHYPEVAKQRPIYQELEALFRFVALAKIMKFKKADQEAGLNLGYLLDRYPVPEVTVNREMPGRSNVKSFRHEKQTDRGCAITMVWFPSCGGVSANISVTPNVFVKDTSGSILKVKTNVITTRPAPEALYWPYIHPNEVKLHDQTTVLACHRSENQEDVPQF